MNLKNFSQLLDATLPRGRSGGGASAPVGASPTASQGFGLQTPSSNTGSHGITPAPGVPNLTSRLHWLQGTASFFDWAEVQWLAEFLCGFTGDEFVWHRGVSRYSGQMWSGYASSVRGLTLFFNEPKHEGQPGKLLVVIPGAWLDRCSRYNSWEIGHSLLVAFNLKFTRIDIAVDDFAKIVTFDDLKDARDCRNFTPFRKLPKLIQGSDGGWSFTFGGRDSGKVLQIYDKATESKGKTNSIRFEGRFRDGYAQCLSLLIFNDFEEPEGQAFESAYSLYLARIIFNHDFVDFIDRSSDPHHVYDMTRLPWWDKYMSCIESDEYLPSIKRPYVESTLERKQSWLQKQTFPTLLVVKEILGDLNFKRWIDRALIDARKTFTEVHYSTIKVLKGDGQKHYPFSFNHSETVVNSLFS